MLDGLRGDGREFRVSPSGARPCGRARPRFRGGKRSARRSCIARASGSHDRLLDYHNRLWRDRAAGRGGSASAPSRPGRLGVAPRVVAKLVLAEEALADRGAALRSGNAAGLLAGLILGCLNLPPRSGWRRRRWSRRPVARAGSAVCIAQPCRRPVGRLLLLDDQLCLASTATWTL